MRKLQSGYIPANEPCPFKAECTPANESPDHCEREKFIFARFSCGLARYMDIAKLKKEGGE